MPDHLDPLDPRFPIELGPRCDLFYATLALWEAHPPRHPARLFAIEEAAHAVALNAREETTFIQPLPPEPPPPPPVPYPALEPATLEHDFTLTGPLDLLPEMTP